MNYSEGKKCIKKIFLRFSGATNCGSDFSGLCYPNQTEVCHSTVTDSWKKSYTKRFEIFKLRGDERERVKTYLNSFPCLKAPHGITLVRLFLTFMINFFFANNPIWEWSSIFINQTYNLQLETDYNLLVQDRIKNRSISDEFGKTLATAFTKNWPSIATKIIDYYLAKKAKKKLETLKLRILWRSIRQK